MFQSISSFVYELQISLQDFIYLVEIYTISRLAATLEPNVKVFFRSHNVHLLSKRKGVLIPSLFEVLKQMISLSNYNINFDIAFHFLCSFYGVP